MSHRAILTAFALLAFASLVAVSIWASGHIDIADALADLLAKPAAGNNPWLVATLFDAYFGFLWFWLWIAYREPGVLSRLVWLVLILLLGNIGMAAYMLLALWRLPTGAPIALLLAPRVRA